MFSFILFYFIDLNNAPRLNTVFIIKLDQNCVYIHDLMIGQLYTHRDENTIDIFYGKFISIFDCILNVPLALTAPPSKGSNEWFGMENYWRKEIACQKQRYITYYGVHNLICFIFIDHVTFFNPPGSSWVLCSLFNTHFISTFFFQSVAMYWN